MLTTEILNPDRAAADKRAKDKYGPPAFAAEVGRKKCVGIRIGGAFIGYRKTTVIAGWGETWDEAFERLARNMAS